METTTYKLKDVLKIGNGKDHSSLPDGEYPVLGSGGIMRYANRYLYDGESVLLPRKGTLNNIQYIKGKFWTVDTCYYTIINQDIAHPYYLYRLLRTFDLSGLDSGASIPSMTSKTYYGIKVQLPPLHTQQKIASILSAYDNLIQNYKKQIEALQTAASELYKEWFVRFRFPGYQTSKFENGIPEGWKIVRFNEIAELINGRAYLMPELQETGKYRIVRVGNFSGKDEWFYSDMELEDNKYCESGDLLYKWACNFGPEIWNEEKVIYHYHIWKVIPNKNNMKKMFLYHLLNFSTPQWLGGTNGTAMVHITKESMEKKRIVLPSFELINEFDIIAENLNKRCRNLEQQITNLTQQRDLLLPRLMNGKLEVLK